MSFFPARLFREFLCLPRDKQQLTARLRRCSLFATIMCLLTVWIAGHPAFGQISDEFNEGSLNTALWQVEAPSGGGASVTGGELVLTVPGGSNHDAFVPALDAVQVVQPISNENFDVAVKIDSTLTASTQYYGQGLMVEGDASDYIRFGVGAGGSIALSANTIISGQQSTPFQSQPFTGYAVPDLSAPDARGKHIHRLLVDRRSELESSGKLQRQPGSDRPRAVRVELQCQSQ